MRRFACTIIFVGSWLAAVPATAQDDRSAKIEALVEEGTAAFKSDQMIEAVEAFKAADELSGDSRIGYNYARALETAGFCQRAEAKFESLAGDESADGRVRELSATKMKDGLECSPMGIVALKCETSGARVTLGGQAALCGDLKRFPIAPVEWTASASGLESASGQVTPEEGRTTTVTIALEEKKVAVPVAATNSGKPWKLLAGGGSLIAGTGLFVAGLVSDSTANTRSEQILDASADGDIDRLDRLESAADTARTRSLALTISGATLAVVGGGLLFWHFSGETTERSLTIAPSVGPENASVTARYRW